MPSSSTPDEADEVALAPSIVPSSYTPDEADEVVLAPELAEAATTRMREERVRTERSISVLRERMQATEAKSSKAADETWARTGEEAQGKCWEYESKGSCKFGGSCRFEPCKSWHAQQGTTVERKSGRGGNSRKAYSDRGPRGGKGDQSKGGKGGSGYGGGKGGKGNRGGKGGAGREGKGPSEC